ncbi:sn-glycerol 3-phosphate transport system permease protein [Paenibacillus sp. RC84]
MTSTTAGTAAPEASRRGGTAKPASARRRLFARGPLTLDFWLNALMFLVALVWIVPLVWMLWTAFRPKDSVINPTLSWDFTLEHFRHVWSAAPFGLYYGNTLLITGGILVVQLLTVTMAAFAFARLNFKGKEFVFMLFLVQIMIPADVLVFPNYNVLKELSLLDTKLGIMLPYFASAFGIFLLRQMFKTIPPELDEAAVMEGCTKWQILWRIYVPLARPSYVAFALVSVSYHWNNFLWPLIVTNSVENRPLTVGLAIFAQSFETGAQWAEVSAATLIVIAPLLAGFLLFQRQFMNSFMQSGIK